MLRKLSPIVWLSLVLIAVSIYWGISAESMRRELQDQNAAPDAQATEEPT